MDGKLEFEDWENGIFYNSKIEDYSICSYLYRP
jgi:hypothetical protein